MVEEQTDQTPTDGVSTDGVPTDGTSTDQTPTDGVLTDQIPPVEGEKVETDEANKSLMDQVKQATTSEEVIDPASAENLKLPEGYKFEGKQAEQLMEIINKTGSRQETAQKLVDLHAQAQKDFIAQQNQAWKTAQLELVEIVKKDPDIGGNNFDSMLETVGKAFDEFGSDEARVILDNSGAGNNLPVVKFIYNMAKEVTESRLIKSNGLGDGELEYGGLYSKSHQQMKEKGMI